MNNDMLRELLADTMNSYVLDELTQGKYDDLQNSLERVKQIKLKALVDNVFTEGFMDGFKYALLFARDIYY